MPSDALEAARLHVARAFPEMEPGPRRDALVASLARRMAEEPELVWVAAVGYPPEPRHWPVLVEEAPEEMAGEDLADPGFAEAACAEDWRGRIGPRVRRLWPTLPRDVRAALMLDARDAADSDDPDGGLWA